MGEKVEWTTLVHSVGRNVIEQIWVLVLYVDEKWKMENYRLPRKLLSLK